jgi:undecaprenyl-diphosphatase
VAVGLSWAGARAAVWIAIALVLAFRWRRPWLLVIAIAAATVSGLLAQALKAVVERPRPPIVLAHVDALVSLPPDSSFPSGHAATSFACAVCLAWAWRSRIARVLLLSLATAIAFSRLYLGVHYPLDVVAGAALGTASAMTLLAILGAAERRPGLDLFARLQHPGGDHPESGQESDPEADPASVGGKELVRYQDQPVEDEDGRQHPRPDQDQALGETGR